MPKVMCCALNMEAGPHHEIFQRAGYEADVVPRDVDLWNEDNLIRILNGCHATLAGSEPYTRKVLESSPEMRVIARTGVGFDAVDLAACDDLGIVVTTTPGVNHHSVAEHTFALMLGIARGFPDNDRRVREGRWRRIARPRVMGRTLGIVGLGRIGKAVAWRARGMGMRVVAYEPYPDTEFVQQWGVDLVSLDELYARSDYVSLHSPATAETRHLINAESLAKMRKGSILINTARGSLVDEAALCEALKSGHIRGAALDVFEEEPLPLDSPLLEFDNVLTAGHLAGLDEESHNDTCTMAAETVIALKNGEWPAFCIQNLKGVKDWRWDR